MSNTALDDKNDASAAASPSFSALLARACAETLRAGPRGRKSQARGPRQSPSNSHVLLRKAVAKMDADEVERLLDEGASIWPQDKVERGSLFDAWLQAARKSSATASEAARVAICLDRAGAPMLRTNDYSNSGQETAALKKISQAMAKGGADLRRERLRAGAEWLEDWHRFGEVAARGLGGLWASWRNDADASAKVSAQDAIAIAYELKERTAELFVGFMGVIGAGAKLSAKQWRDVAEALDANVLYPAWEGLRHGLTAWQAEAVLGLKGAGLDASLTGRLVRSAILLDSVEALANVVALGPKEGFKLPARAWADMEFISTAQSKSEGPPALAHALATPKRRDADGLDRGWACFDAMSKVPALVEEAAKRPVPQALASLSSAHLEELWESFPELFGPDDQGDNALRFAGHGRHRVREDGEGFCRRVFKCGLGQALAFEVNAQGEQALSSLEQVFEGIETASLEEDAGKRSSWKSFLAGVEKKELKAASSAPKRAKKPTSRL